MTYKRTICALVLIVVVCVPATVRGADVDDLKAAFEQGLKALNALDVDGFMASAHDQSVTFGTSSPFPVDGKAAQQQVLQTSSVAARVRALPPSIPNSA